ncbi:MFS transporter [Mumia zhuanghuii]|uniref:MFS transporter n=2 Tax=Mumia TaxID=1546255 RepID=A0ABW1QG36_9ACTN|nr:MULTISPECIES: MFS transporter [Mumia]KAA1422925.1 MFS transporter [Mumia zhuanghuii]
MTALRRARVATSAFFVLNGFTIGVWVVNIPTIQDRAGIDTVLLGWLLLLMGASAFVGMQLGGRLADAIGSAPVELAGGAVMGVMILGPALARDPYQLAAGLVLLGLANGILDVSMNTQAVEVERAYERHVMGTFHAFYSVGGLLAAVVGGLAIRVGVPLPATAAVLAGTGLLLSVAARSSVWRAPRTPVVPAAQGTETAKRTSGWTVQVAGLAALAFALFLAEGVAGDWSAVHLHDVLDADKSTAAWAFGAFSLMMTIGRLLTDRVVTRVGRATFVRTGALLAGAGLATAALAPSVPLAVVGWAVFGIGLSGCVPQFLSAAGHLDPARSGTNVARVAGFGYVGLLAGPALIGVLTAVMPLTAAFWFPVAGCVAAGLVAPLLLRPAVDARQADVPG